MRTLTLHFPDDALPTLDTFLVTAQAYQEVIIPWCKTDKNRAQ
jgi:hypothetical protein